jgi:glycosyltransferase involved in cell wall biosynthesis
VNLPKIRVAVLTTSFPRSLDDEAGVFVARLIDAFDKTGLSGVVFVPKDGNEPIDETRGSFLVRRFSYGVFQRGKLAFGMGILPNLRNNPLLIFQAPTLILGFLFSLYRFRESWSVIHANWLFAALAARLYSTFTGRPYVVTVRGEDMRILRHRFLRFVGIFALQRAVSVIAVSEGFAREIRLLVPPIEKRVQCIPNGVAMTVPLRSEAYRRLNLSADSDYLLYVGRIIELKNIELLLRILGDPRLSRHQLLLCGRFDNNSYFASLMRLIEETQLQGRVSFVGQVSPSLIPHYLSVAKIFLSASRYEGRPNSVLEALAAGRVALVSDIPAHAEIVRNGENGYLLSPSEPSDWVEKILELTRSRETVEKLEEGAKSSVAHLSWEAAAVRYRRAFEGERSF